MADKRSYSRAGRRDIISASDLLAKTGEYALICLPVPALEIARIMVRNRGYWRTSYADTYGEHFYTLPDMADFDVITGFLDEFLEGTTVMDCNDFISELNDIEAAITALGGSGGCGCGSGGAGATSPPPDDTDTGDITEETGTPPGGYTNWAEYQIFKCDIATWVVNNLLADIRWFQGVQIATMTLAGLSAGVLSVLSAFTLTGVLAALIAILAYEFTMLEDLETIIEENFEDLLCDIMQGTTSATSMANFIAGLETLIDAEVADPISEFLLKQLVSYWQDTSSFNLLYAHKDDVEMKQIPAGGDCGACGVSCSSILIGTGTYLGGNVWASGPLAGRHHIAIHMNSTGGGRCVDPCGAMELFSFQTFVGWTDYGGGEYSFKVYQDSDCPFTPTNATVYQSDTMPPMGVEYCGGGIEVISGTAFTMELERIGKCIG